jgi:hypothetical protein
MSLVMIAPKRRTPRLAANRPTPTVWSAAPRGSSESAMDTDFVEKLFLDRGASG